MFTNLCLAVSLLPIPYTCFKLPSLDNACKEKGRKRRLDTQSSSHIAKKVQGRRNKIFLNT